MQEFQYQGGCRYITRRTSSSSSSTAGYSVFFKVGRHWRIVEVILIGNELATVGAVELELLGTRGAAMPDDCFKGFF